MIKNTILMTMILINLKQLKFEEMFEPFMGNSTVFNLTHNRFDTKILGGKGKIDWLVLFYSEDYTDSIDILPMFYELAHNLTGEINLGVVDWYFIVYK